jgi:hypothetical protein
MRQFEQRFVLVPTMRNRGACPCQLAISFTINGAYGAATRRSPLAAFEPLQIPKGETPTGEDSHHLLDPFANKITHQQNILQANPPVSLSDTVVQFLFSTLFELLPRLSFVHGSKVEQWNQLPRLIPERYFVAVKLVLTWSCCSQCQIYAKGN